MPTLHDLETATRDLPLIGHLVSVDWNGVAVDRRSLLPRLTAVGFGDHAPPTLSHQVSLGRAIRSWIKERAAAGQRAGLGRADGAIRPDRAGGRQGHRDLVRVARDGASAWILFGIIAEAIDLDQLGLRYRTDLRVLVHKQTGAMLVTTEALGPIDDQAQAPPEAQVIARQLQPHWEATRHQHTASDLGEMSRSILRALGAVNVQEGSGWYFVPLARQADLARLRDLIEALPTINGSQPFILMLGQIDAAATRRQLAQAAHRDFLAQLAAARADLAAFVEKPAGTVRAATVASRLAEYRHLKQRASLYAGLLDMQQEQIQRELAELTAQARAIVVRATDGPAATPADGAVSLPLPGLVAVG